MRSFLINALTLSRFSNLPTVWTNILAAWAINSTASSSLKIIPELSDLTFFNWNTFFFLVIGASLIYAGGCTLNDVIDLKFDLVFIDADKKNYKNYFDQVIHKLNKGGIIIVDNVLWKGKVTDLSKNQNDKIAVYMNDFNEYIKKNKKVSKLILPVRDGLTLIIKDEN